MSNKEENIKNALTNDLVLQTITLNLKKGKPVELKVEKNNLVIVGIERHASLKINIGEQE